MTKIPVFANVVVASNVPTLSANLYAYRDIALWANADVIYTLGPNNTVNANAANVSVTHFLPANCRVELTTKRYPGSLDEYGNQYISFLRVGAANVSVYISAFDTV